ncbi:MAG: ion transporter, partial [Eggerthellaceae bacterium]|nr:ion transporter [Eggerthellaceae bacterium]
FKQLRIIVEAIGRSMVGVGWTALLLILMMYVFDVIGISIFGDAFPEYFDNLGTGLFTLFEVLTLEGWNSIAHDIMAVYPAAWLYFIPYVIFSAFIMINVVTGIIINAVDESTQIERINRYDSEEAQLVTELGELKAQVETVQYLLSKMCIQMAPAEKPEGAEDAEEPEDSEDSEE